MTLVAAVALVVAGCSGNKAEKASATGTDSVATELAPEVQQATDSLTALLTKSLDEKNAKAVTDVLATLETKYAELVKEGKLEEAKSYALKIQEFVNEHAENIKSLAAGNTTISSLVDGIKNLPTNAETTAEEAAAAVSSDAQTIATAAKAAAAAKVSDAADAVKDAAKEKVDNAVSDAKSKASEAVSNAQQKAADKVTNAQKKANEKVNDAANKALKGLGL